MAVIIIFIALVLLFLLALTVTSCLRKAILQAVVMLGVLVFVITELLSIFHAITFFGVFVMWLLVCIATIIFIKFRWKKFAFSLKFKRLSILSIILLVGVVAIAIITLIIALNAPPNTYDSMTYHMSRIAHWIQNGSVMHYPTHILRQIYNTSWAEYAILQFQILSGGDRLANLVQWLSMTGCLIGVSLIAVFFGAKARGQILSVVACATLPMGILQSSSTQTDYVVALWLVCFVYNLLMLIKTKSWMSCAFAGAALGLALLTKRTAYIYALPFLIWMGFICLREFRSGLWRRVIVLVTIAIIVNSGFYFRNMSTFGNPLGDKYLGDRYERATAHSGNLQRIGQNAKRYFALQLDIPINAHLSSISKNIGSHLATQSSQLNAVIEKNYSKLNEIVGINLYDQKLTAVRYVNKFKVQKSLDEDCTGNFLHFLLIIFLIPIAVAMRRFRSLPAFLVYFIIILIGFFYLGFRGWSPFNVRYHLPLFVLLAPFIGVILESIPVPFLGEIIAAILIYSSNPWVLKNNTRPLIGMSNIFNKSRNDQYFRKFDHLRLPYESISKFIADNHFTNVGIYCDSCGIEYPLHVLFQKYSKNKIHVEHVNVKNISKKIQSLKPKVNPQIIIALNNFSGKIFRTTNAIYKRVWLKNQINVFVRSDIVSEIEEEGRDLYKQFNKISKDAGKNLLKNGEFLDGLKSWTFWNQGRNFTNAIKIISCRGKFGESKALRIENPYKKLIGIQQNVPVVSGKTYRLSCLVRSTITSDSKKIFGGRIGFWMPTQKEKQIVWMSEHNKWWKKELVFINKVTGKATVYLHMGYGNIASTGEFTKITLEEM